MKIQIINGPNLNLLGKREPEVYGTQSFETFFKTLMQSFPQVELYYFQSNLEGVLSTSFRMLGSLMMESFSTLVLIHTHPWPSMMPLPPLQRLL